MADRTADPTRLLIVSYSRSGSIEKLPAEAAREAGAVIRVRRPREGVDAATLAEVDGWSATAARQNALDEAPTHDDAGWGDAILFGTRCYFGAMATELKNYLDLLGPQGKRGARAGEVGGAFAAASWPHGGCDAGVLASPVSHQARLPQPGSRWSVSR